MSNPKSYFRGEITVTFDLSRCIHSAECLRRLPQVFDTNRRPWIQPENKPFCDNTHRTIGFKG